MSAADLAARASTLLFVPGDRPERFEKAAAAGADLVVLDLEDAVKPENKESARENVARWAAEHECAVRVNAADTQWHRQDVAALADTGAAIMVAKAENPRALAAVGAHHAVIALVETAAGVLAAPAIAAADGVVRIALGTFDLAAQLGVDPTDTEALAATRGGVVLASAAAGLGGPIDGVTAVIDDAERLGADTGYARRLGFAGKLCIHPRQLGPVAAAFRPSEDEIAWARKIVAAVDATGVAKVDGAMVDKPVVERAQRILSRADA
ncbi:MAG: CoA ester lyase [Gordonia sp. (in: high G+C Gram-positive bacteria)]|uniref:HpcH/HpaI aldolase/citrate lyase family protein n=1 Tax=Gordonia sp. (in: high G+C Gram-positive bacteria) TaxID=84139 RepID=UPI0039E306F5